MMRLVWRRVARSLFWVGLCSLVLVGTTGWVSGTPSKDISLSREPWRIGDAGAYTVVLTGDWPYDGRSEGEPLPGPAFEAQAIEQVLDADGAWQQSLRVAWSGEERTPAGWAERVEHRWIDGERRIASVRTTQATTAGGVLEDPVRRHVEERAYAADGRSDCLLLPPWHAGPLSVPCHVAGTGIDLPAGTSVDLVGRHEVDGVRALHLRAVDGGVKVDWWLAPGAPVAWRVDASQGDQGVSFTLDRFQRGAGDSVSPGAWPGAALQWSHRQPWGPDEAGLDHPFTAGDAYNAALQDPTFSGLRDWLHDHPDGYLFMHSYQEDQDDRSTRRQWTLHFSDGEAGYSLRVSQDDGASLLPSRPVMEPIAAHHLADDAPHRDALPSKMPTVAAMWQRWALQSDQDANAWGMRILADGDGEAVVEYAAGRVASLDWGPGGVTLGDIGGSRSSASIAAFDDDGRTVRIISESQGRGAEASEAPSRPAPWTPSSMSAVGRSWQWPDGTQSAGIGLIAAALATTYLAWPAIKTLGVGLFSRLHGPALLEHPTRQAVMDAARAEPGIHFGALAQRIGAPAGQVRHHVRKLVDGELLIERRSPGYTCYFPSKGTSRSLIDAAPVLRAAGARQMLAALASEPGANAKTLAQAVGLSPATATYHLKRLQDVGLVVATRDGRSLSLRLTPDGRSAVGSFQAT